MRAAHFIQLENARNSQRIIDSLAWPDLFLAAITPCAKKRSGHARLIIDSLKIWPEYLVGKTILSMLESLQNLKCMLHLSMCRGVCHGLESRTPS